MSYLDFFKAQYFCISSDDNEDGIAADDEAEERLERASMKLKVILIYDLLSVYHFMPTVIYHIA